MKFILRFALPVLAVVCLTHCGAPNPPQCHRVPRESRAPATTLIESARTSWEVLADGSRKADWPKAEADYNTAVARLFDQLRCGKGSWQDRAGAMGTAIFPAKRHKADPTEFDALFPASDVKLHREKRRHLTPGIGVALVGWKETTPINVPRPAFQPPTGMPYAVNATLRFDKDGKPVWHFVKRWIDDDFYYAETRRPLAADWTAPNVFYWNMSNLDDLTIQNVLLPGRYMEETGLYFLQPYDPKKIPIVMVHGLKSSPDAFRHIINNLSPEPWFREKYQVWLFNYPTGNPWLYTGIRFREYINAATKYARTQGDDTQLNKMVILAHSMGGLITRSSITDPGNVIYDEHFDQPLDQLKVNESTRELIRAGMYYKPLKEPKRVVFLAVPHRGSPLATMRFAIMTSNFIRLPKILTVDLLDATLHAAKKSSEAGSEAPRMPTSISSLSPKSRGIKALAKMPLPQTIHFHSIVGNRGRGHIPDCSDGVVPYRSSCVNPVESEKVVPWGHGVTDCPVSSEEIKRILRLHLQ
jgi:hypothetical protein